MSMTIDEWFASVDGKSVGPNDTNGQCVGLYYDYMSNCLGITPVDTNYGPHAGYAIGTWDSGKPPAGLTAVKGASDIRKGDIVFWNYGAPFTLLSHVAVAMGTNAYAGTGNFASQNSPLPFAVKQQLPLLGVAGVWRPNNGQQMTGADPTGATQVGETVANTGSVMAQLGTVFSTLSGSNPRVPNFWPRVGLMLLGITLLLIAFWSIVGESAVDSVKKVI